jgi:hypothetical protein
MKIDLLKENEAVVSGNTMIVCLPHGMYKIGDRVVSIGWNNNQVAVNRDEVIYKHTPPRVKVVGYTYEDGKTISFEDAQVIRSLYCYDGEYEYQDLDTEFAHRKQLLELEKATAVTEQTEEVLTPLEFTIVGEVIDTGSKYIETAISYGAARFSSYDDSFYRLDVTQLLGDTIKQFATDNNLRFDNSNSGYRFCKIDGAFVSTPEWENLLKEGSSRVLPTLEEAKKVEQGFRSKMLNHLRGKYIKSTLDEATRAEIYSDLESILRRLGELEVKQKSVYAFRNLKTAVSNLKDKLGNV